MTTNKITHAPADVIAELDGITEPIALPSTLLEWVYDQNDEELSRTHKAARLLADNGTLVFKWNSDQVKLSKVLELVPDELVATIQNRVNKTYICVFIKRGIGNEEV